MSCHTFGFPIRSMPYVQPSDLLPWLLQFDLWPDIPDRKITRYWNHMKSVGSDIANVSPTGEHHPLWIWGDGANYAKDQSIITICIGSILDDRTDSITKCFPIALCREEPWVLIGSNNLISIKCYPMLSHKCYLVPLLCPNQLRKEVLVFQP